MRSVLSTLLLFVLASCGGSTSPVDAGTPEVDGGLADAGMDAGTGLVLAVVSGTSTRTVDLSTLSTHALGVKTVVGLEAVVAVTFPELQGTAFKVNFKASDNFDPASKAGCAPLLPLAESLLPRGGIDPLTRNLAWDDALGYPGCLYVHDCTTLTLVP
jgi:hypothetical protein